MIDERAYRNAMGKFATGITIVTVKDNGEKKGMTVNSFMSVSLSPKLIAISIDKKASMYSIIQNAPYIGVSILSEEQKDIAQIFAKQIDYKPINFTDGVKNTPVISNALTTIVCQQKENIIVGDHIVIFGEVLSLDSIDKNPVIFLGGKYHSIGNEL